MCVYVCVCVCVCYVCMCISVCISIRNGETEGRGLGKRVFDTSAISFLIIIIKLYRENGSRRAMEKSFLFQIICLFIG